MKLFNYKIFTKNEKMTTPLDGVGEIYSRSSDKFKNILDKIKSNTSKELKSSTNDQISYVDTTDKNDTISFIQTKNIERITNKNEDLWETSSRQNLKIGRFIKKILDCSQQDIDIFVNDYKAMYNYNEYSNRFEIVYGNDITKYYYYKNQVLGGQLQKSCMRELTQQKYIKDFLEPNKKIIKMLILKDKESPDLIIGRANLWLLTNPYNRIYMDRIYVNEDYLINIFIQYAKENNYIYKSKQIYGGNIIPVVDNNETKNIIMSAMLIPKKYEYYPYIDTLQFFNEKTGEITNDVKKWDTFDWITLIHAGGGYLTKDDDKGFKMDYLGRLVHPYFVKWSNVDNCYIHESSAIYLHYKSDYCRPDTETIKINDNNYLKSDAFFDKITKRYKIKKK